MNGMAMGRKENWQTILTKLMVSFFNWLYIFISGFAAIMATVLPVNAVYLLFTQHYIPATFNLVFGVVFIWINLLSSRGNKR